MAPSASAVHYVPLVTTVVAVAFGAIVLARFRHRGGAHLAWWGAGMLCYGAGTLTESLTTLFGWSAPVFRAWYITGALMGGAPLAQGTVYLLLPRRIANRLTEALVTLVLVAATCAILSPLNYALVEPHRLSGRVFAWQWVRAFSPFINLYSAGFLIGGAVLSAVRYARAAEGGRRALGNVAIAVGGLLPGIGGSFTRFGMVEVLYVTELLGLLLLFLGYRLNTTAQSPSIHRGAARAAAGRA
jgi:hypothetical protein